MKTGKENLENTDIFTINPEKENNEKNYICIISVILYS